MDDKSRELREGISGAASAAAAKTGQAQKALSEAGEAVQQAAGQAWSQAGDVADDVLAAGQHGVQAASRQINEQPLLAMIAGFAFGYIAALVVHGRR